MIKCEVIKDFNLRDFDKLKNVQRSSQKNKYGELYVKDIFECDKEMADYLMGGNRANKVVVKVIEIVPEEEKKEEIVSPVEEKPKRKRTSKK